MNILQQATDMLARLEQAHAAAPHEDDAGAPNEQQRRWQDGQTRMKHIRLVRSDIAAIKEADAQLPQLEQWLSFLVFARQTLCDEYLACDRRSPKRDTLELSIRQIDRGLPFSLEMLPVRLPLDDLLRVAGYQSVNDTLVSTSGRGWRGCLPEVERKVAALIKQREHAERRLADALTFAERLLSEPATS